VRSLDRLPVVARILSGLGRLLGIVHDESGTVSIEYEHTGDSRDDYGYLELDLSSSEPGEQVLRVRVDDAHAGTWAEATTTFTIGR
jgi:hypothetical protein